MQIPKIKQFTHAILLLFFLLLTLYVYFFADINLFSVNKVYQVLYDLSDIDKSSVDGNSTKDDNPWKSSVAKIKLDSIEKTDKLYNRSGLFTHPVSSVKYNVLLPVSKNLKFTSFIGIHPLARKWGSDGVRYKLICICDGTENVELDKYIMPDDGYIEVSVNLNKYSSKSIEIIMSTINDPNKDSNADWATWIEPVISN